MDKSTKKTRIQQLINDDSKSISFFKPKESPKRSIVWQSFSIICVDGKKQEIVSCDKCKQLMAYRARDGTNSLARHTRSCKNESSIPSSNSSNQNQVTDYFSSSKTSIIPKKIKDRVKIGCVEFIALDSRPFETVSGEGFMKLAQSLFDAGKYFSPTSTVNLKDLIPSPVTVSRNVEDLYKKKQSELAKLCINIKYYCIICDFWTERYTGLSYCGLALRYITIDYRINNFILGCFLYDIQTQSASNVRTFVENKLVSFGLVLNSNVFVVTDNENKMRAAFKDKCIRIGCSIHYLNKQLEHSFTSEEIEKQTVKCDKVQHLFENVKKVATHVRRTHRQVKLSRKVQLYSDTRFNGAFHMLNVFLKVFDDIGVVLNNNYLSYFTVIDKELLEEVCKFLELFEEVINKLSQEERPTIYMVIPLRQLLINHCEPQFEDTAELKELKVFLGNRIKSAWIPQEQHYICTLLHPSLKHFHAAPNEKNKALKIIRKELLSRTSNVISATGKSPTAVSRDVTNTVDNVENSVNNLLTRCFDKVTPEIRPVQSPLKELDEYMISTKTISETDDILLFWKNQEEQYPTLSTIVRELFSIPASNTIVERLFSASKIIVNDKRTNLSHEKLNQLLFLKKNSTRLKEIHNENLSNSQTQSRKKTLISGEDVQTVCANDQMNNSILSLNENDQSNNDDDDDPTQDFQDDNKNSIDIDNIFTTIIHCTLTDSNLNIIDEIVDGKANDDLMNFFHRNQIHRERTIVVAGMYLGRIRAHLKQLAPQFNEFCHYRSIDVDVISLICEKWFPNIYKQRPLIKDENQLKYSIDLLRFYRSTIFK
ncbi:unnamed protein product [Rotaria socialis]|uniref:Transposase n=4 Tax=Rotaria socialis TaxID=392032 RepID=A0A818BK30_9BILA|nr:unnamed protein product [Rotaria socialis]